MDFFSIEKVFFQHQELFQHPKGVFSGFSASTVFYQHLRLVLEMLLALEMMVPPLVPQFAHESPLAEAALRVQLYLQVFRPIV